MLYLTLGPMFAGKTSALIKQYLDCSGSKIIIDYNINNESNNFISVIKNHCDSELECIKAKTLNIKPTTQDPFILDQTTSLIHDKFISSQNIFINEAQFFPDLYEFVIKNEHKNIYIYGLDGDFKREPIGQILSLIPLCDSVIKLKATCICGETALFTHRDSTESIQYLPHAKYIPKCRGCYLNKK